MKDLSASGGGGIMMPCMTLHYPSGDLCEKSGEGGKGQRRERIVC